MGDWRVLRKGVTGGGREYGRRGEVGGWLEGKTEEGEQVGGYHC